MPRTQADVVVILPEVADTVVRPANAEERFYSWLSTSPRIRLHDDDVNRVRPVSDLYEIYWDNGRTFMENFQDTSDLMRSSYSASVHETAIEEGRMTKWILTEDIGLRSVLACATTVPYPVWKKTHGGVIEEDVMYVVECEATPRPFQGLGYEAAFMSGLHDMLKGSLSGFARPRALGSLISIDAHSDTYSQWDMTGHKLNSELVWEVPPVQPESDEPVESLGAEMSGLDLDPNDAPSKLKVRWLYDGELSTVASLQSHEDRETLKGMTPEANETLVMFDSSNPKDLVRQLDLLSQGDGNVLRMHHGTDEDAGPVRGIYFTSDGADESVIKSDTPLFLFGHHDAHNEDDYAETVSVNLSRGITGKNLPGIIGELTKILNEQGFKRVNIPGVDPEAASTQAWVDSGASLVSKVIEETCYHARGLTWYGEEGQKHTLMSCDGWVID